MAQLEQFFIDQEDSIWDHVLAKEVTHKHEADAIAEQIWAMTQDLA